MPDGLTAPAPEQENTTRTRSGHLGRRAPWVGIALQMAVTIGLFAGAGVLSGWAWFRLWTPPQGVVVDHQWFPNPAEAGLRAEFAGTGWYVVVALVGGLLLGTLCAYVLDRSELATLVAVVIGSVLAAWLMLEVGVHLGPPDPQTLAGTAEDGTELPGHLEVARLSPKLSYPGGALLGLTLDYLLTLRRDPSE